MTREELAGMIRRNIYDALDIPSIAKIPHDELCKWQASKKEIEASHGGESHHVQMANELVAQMKFHDVESKVSEFAPANCPYYDPMHDAMYLPMPDSTQLARYLMLAAHECSHGIRHHSRHPKLVEFPWELHSDQFTALEEIAAQTSAIVFLNLNAPTAWKHVRREAVEYLETWFKHAYAAKNEPYWNSVAMDQGTQRGIILDALIPKKG